MSLKKKFVNSARELKDTRSLAFSAMLLAIAVVVGFFAIQVTESIKISFAFLVDELCGALFGPVVGMIEGGLADLLKYLVAPTGPYFPGFTISSIVGGLIYGLFLYGRKVTLRRVIACNATITVFVNMVLNTYWLTMLYGSAFMAIFPARIVKELIMLPINVAMFYGVYKALEKSKAINKVKVVRAEDL